MLRLWLWVSALLLCLTTQLAREVGAIKATTLKLRTNPKADLKLTKRSYLSTTFRTNNESVFGFFVDVLVGTPPQFFSLAFSTSSTTWLPVSNLTAEEFCDTVASGDSLYACFYDSFFEPNKSSTFEPLPGELDNYYGEGLFAQGTWGSDVFKINQLSLSNVSFGLASNWTNAAELGLGVEYNRRLSPYPSIPEIMANEGAINSILYSIYINDIRNDGGEIFFGAIDQAKFNGSLRTYESGKVGEVPVSGVYYIAPDGTNTSLVDQELIVSNQIGEIQLGTPSLWIPNEVYRGLVNSVPELRYTTAYDAYTIDCSTPDEDLGVMQFDIDGMVISIGVRQILVEYPTGSGICVLTAYQNEPSSTSDPEYILGTPFLRSAFAVFDWSNNKTSIAPSIANSTASTLKEVPEGGIEDLPQESGTPTPTTTTSPTPTATPTETTSAPAEPQSGSSTNVGAIVGGSVGGALALGIGAFLTWFIMRRRRKSDSDMPPAPQAPDMPQAPLGPPMSGPMDYNATTHVAQTAQQYKPQVSVVQHTYGVPPTPQAQAPATSPPSAYQENWSNMDYAQDRTNSVTSGTTYAQADLSSFNVNGNPRMSGRYDYNSNSSSNYAEMPANRYNY
ncbi:Barrierpepsin [Dactylella cylindrospora]|nr:Barrierpepsin [Dactylella cylindrospora]